MGITLSQTQMHGACFSLHCLAQVKEQLPWAFETLTSLQALVGGVVGGTSWKKRMKEAGVGAG